MAKIFENHGKSNAHKVIKTGDVNHKCRGNVSVKSRPTCVKKQNAMGKQNALVKPLSNSSDVIIHDNRQGKSISVKQGLQNIVNQNNWASKNRLALLSDINPQSHCDGQEVPTVQKVQVKCNSIKDAIYKVGAQCVDRQTVNPCVLTPDTDKITTSKVTNNLQQKTCDVQNKYELDLRFHPKIRGNQECLPEMVDKRILFKARIAVPSRQITVNHQMCQSL